MIAQEIQGKVVFIDPHPHRLDRVYFRAYNMVKSIIPLLSGYSTYRWKETFVFMTQNNLRQVWIKSFSSLRSCHFLNIFQGCASNTENHNWLLSLSMQMWQGRSIPTMTRCSLFNFTMFPMFMIGQPEVLRYMLNCYNSTLTMPACYMEYPLKWALADITEAHFIGYFTKQ